jgi:hypothetical protein
VGDQLSDARSRSERLNLCSRLSAGAPHIQHRHDSELKVETLFRALRVKVRSCTSLGIPLQATVGKACATRRLSRSREINRGWGCLDPRIALIHAILAPLYPAVTYDFLKQHLTVPLTDEIFAIALRE